MANVLVAALLFWHTPQLNPRAETITWAEPQIENIYVYGENMHFTLQPGFGEDVLLIKDKSRHYYLPGYANRGLYLPRLSGGLYRLYAGDLCVLAPPDFEFTGYTIARSGRNLHYRLFSEEGRLVLEVAEIKALPAEVFDIIIDPGHGGISKGAVAGNRFEKDENLRASLYMAELFSEAGLKVALTRSGDYLPGYPPEDLDDDKIPYITEGRIYLGYSTQAKYYISNHLNGGARRGWQLYRSVQADDRWQQAISAAFIAYGHEPNDDFHGFGRAGIYRRYSDDAPNRDYYFVLRETGGEITQPVTFAAAFPQMDLRKGAESMLMEYVFLDNPADLRYWDENWQGLVEATVEGCLNYWGIK